MEIYIYSLILAGYALLYFLSRDAEGTGMTRMAVFLYEKGRALGQKSKGRNVFHESGIRRDLSVLYPYGKLEGEERRFYVERIRIALMILLVGDILAAAGYAAAEGSMLLQGGGLVREEIGGEDRSTQLDAYIVQRAENSERSAAEGDGAESGSAADEKPAGSRKAMRAAPPIKAATGWRSARAGMMRDRRRPWRSDCSRCSRKESGERIRACAM